MTKKQLKIQIFPDGRIQAETVGIKGKKCLDYMEILEELLEAEIIDSEYTSEFYETEQVEIEEVQHNKIKNEI